MKVQLGVDVGDGIAVKVGIVIVAGVGLGSAVSVCSAFASWGVAGVPVVNNEATNVWAISSGEKVGTA